VRVTVQVSVTGPDDPCTVFTVTTVIGEPFCRFPRPEEMFVGTAEEKGRRKRQKERQRSEDKRVCISGTNKVRKNRQEKSGWPANRKLVSY